jgi:putative sporulation protein YyaC
LVRHLGLLMQDRQFKNRKVIVLCIGSIRYTGDSLAPLVGTFLKEMAAACAVYGELENPVHACNLQEVLTSINREHDMPVIIAIDAALGKPGEVGNIELWKGALFPGVSVDNHLPRCGDISIIGVVNALGLQGHRDLEKTPLNIVYKHARIIAQAVNIVLTERKDRVAEAAAHFACS